MKIEDLKPVKGSKKSARRVGRGKGSGWGKTSAKGHKGQKARSGGTKGPSFEGGQTPLQRRLPKRGFKNAPFKKEFVTLNIKDIAKLENNIDAVTPEILLQNRVIRKLKDGVKILGTGEISRPLTIKAHAFSSSAISKIKAAGGKVEVIK
jgi:large subunit ribosomal protein L15